MQNENETKFYESLQNTFVGSPANGSGGYINLLRIKEKYYKNILDVFKESVNGDAVVSADFKEDFFRILFSFFQKYFSECGCVYFVQSASWQKVYEKVYTDNEDVVLFWKTHMLYYVKSDIIFKNVFITVNKQNTTEDYVFYFDVDGFEQKQNNTKKELVFKYRETKVGKIKGIHDDKTGDKTFVFTVSYKEGNRKIDYQAEANEAQVDLQVLETAIAQFKKQTTVDFFINKDADRFLNEQLDLFLHQYLLETDSQFDQIRLNQIKAVKRHAQNLISFIGQFENELTRIWNKPKFVLNSYYVITIDLLAPVIVEKIAKHKNLKAQIAEWIERANVDDDFVFDPKEVSATHLPIRTKYFKDLEIEILAQFENLDEALDGRLIHSENYQALNTLKTRYNNQIQCVYIDPPFNTGNDFEYIDGYQDSTWLSIMNDRLSFVPIFLADNGSLYLHLDENANYYGRILCDKILTKNNEIIWNKGFRGTESKRILQHSHDTILYYSKENGSYIWNQPTEEYKDPNKGRYNKVDENGDKYALIKRTHTDGSTYYGKTYPKQEGKSANDVISYVPTMASTNRQRWASDLTQKPEELLQIFIEASSNVGDMIFDFFAGSGTTIATALKSKRKWIGVEMGEYQCNNVIIPRLMEILMKKGKHEPCGITDDVSWKGGGFFKYYDLEQYEDTLARMVYSKDKGDVFAKDVFNQYIFFADKKLTDILKIDGENINLDFDKLFEGKTIDLAETVSLLFGKPILKITADEVYLQGMDPIKINTAIMTNAEKVAFAKMIKELLWWGE